MKVIALALVACVSLALLVYVSINHPDQRSLSVSLSLISGVFMCGVAAYKDGK